MNDKSEKLRFNDQNEEQKGFDIDFKDFIAIFIAILQTVLLPIVLIAGLLLLFAIIIGMTFGA